MKKIKSKMHSKDIIERLITSSIMFLVLFIMMIILSYYILPEGILLGKQSANFNLASNFLLCALQIFSWNLISIFMIFISSLFSKKGNNDEEYFSLGYEVFFILIMINAVTLGTWSFAVRSESISLLNRIIGLFNISKNAGLVEMFGQLLITCSLANISIVKIFKNKTTTRKFKDIELNSKEKVAIIMGLLLIFAGALIETSSIISVNMY